MNKFRLLPVFAVLALTACDQALPTTPETPPLPPMATDSAFLVAQRLQEFHTPGHSTRPSDQANAAKISPTDTIDLLPPDLVLPSRTTIRWRYIDEAVSTPIDPSRALRVPLRNGIMFNIDSTWYGAIHNAVGSIAPPTITPGSQTMDFFADSIAITSLRPGTRIHYTLDGSYPTSSSPVYTSKIPLDRPYRVRAIAQVPGQGPSLATSVAYPEAKGWNPAIVYDTLVDTRDGQAYPTVHLGNQTWMAKNLNWSVPGGSLRDGWEGAVYTVDQVQVGGICPEGWSVPSRADWDSLVAWGTRQPGVTKANFGNALRSTALFEGWQPPETANHIDLFGFRATSTSFWMRTPADDSGMVLLRTFSQGSLVETTHPTWTSQWSYNYELQTHYIMVPTTSRVRCLKDAP